jgi:hypothetical protein
MRTRLTASLLLLCLAAPALAQPAKRPPSLEARVDALEKENAALRADVTRLEEQLAGTRYGLAASAGAVGSLAYPPTIQPQPLAQQQANADAIIQQNNMATQMNNLQMQQNLMMDRQREQQLSQPQIYGPTPGATP